MALPATLLPATLLPATLLPATLLGATLLGCSGSTPPPQPVVDTSSSTQPVVTALAPDPTPPRRPPHDKLVMRHTLAVDLHQRCLIDAGAVYCWGSEHGKPALEAPVREHATRIAIPTPATSVAVSRSHHCATTRDGAVWCWGSNFTGDLGAGRPSSETPEAPVRVLDIDDALSVAVGGRHTCVVRRGGKLSCWGANDAGQAGHPTAYTRQAARLVRPVEVAGLGPADEGGAPTAAGGKDGVVDVTLGDRYACAAFARGQTRCWGRFRGLGHAPRIASHQPHRVARLRGAARLAAHSDFGCAVLQAAQDGGATDAPTDGAVQCWGYPYAGRLGHQQQGPSWQQHANAPRVENLGGALKVAVGNAHACALVQGGAVWCWGMAQDGQLGRGLPDDLGADGDHRAQRVPGVSGAQEVAAGASVSCALTRDEVICWGEHPWSYSGDAVLQPEGRAIR